MDTRHKSSGTPSAESPSLLGLASAVWKLLGPSSVALPTPDGTIQLDTNGLRRKVDFYSPLHGGARRSACILLVHGGGFVLGSRNMKPLRGLVRAFVDAGFPVASMDYALVPRGSLEQQKQEVLDTVKWLASSGKHSGPVIGIGLSAGAAILTHAAAENPNPWAGLCLVYGALWFSDSPSKPVRWVYKRLLPHLPEGEWSLASAGHFLGKDGLPHPTLFVHGTADTVCSADWSTGLHAIRTLEGLPSQLHLAEEHGHGYLNAPEDSAAQSTTARMVEFALDLLETPD